MEKRRIALGLVAAALVLSMVFAAASWWRVAPARSASAEPQLESQLLEPQAPDAAGTLALSYAAKVVCTKALVPGTPWVGAAAPLVDQHTDVLVHNPQDFPVSIYYKAVSTAPNPVISGYKKGILPQDGAIRFTCTQFYSLLGVPAPLPGDTLEGYLVFEVGPEPVGGAVRYPTLDVTGEYVRSSEVMKKDIHFQPWWNWWYSPLPWRLAYPYQRVIPVSISPGSFDCSEILYTELKKDAAPTPDGPQTVEALDNGYKYYSESSVMNLSHANEAALVALIGKCDKLAIDTNLFLSVDYVIFSNKGPTDQGPLTPDAPPPYPWIPGRWNDVPLVTPQNINIDMHDYMRNWHREAWIVAGATPAQVDVAMPYFFPYWCGWNYWAWWTPGGDCIDIGVGEGESLDVEQYTPQRVIRTTWPPPTSGGT